MPESPIYNVPVAVRLSGLLDSSALELSLRHIEQRHEVLRTCFSVIDSQPVQVISPEPSLRLRMADLSDSESAEREALELAAAEARRPFDLSRGPVWRAVLVRVTEEDHVLVLTAHHIVTDHWSMGVLVREVGQLYEKYKAGEAVELKELAVQYADYAVWQREWLQAEVLDRQLDYWKQQLAGAPDVSSLPTDRPRPPEQAFRGAYQNFELTPLMSNKLRELSRKESVTLFMTLMAAFKTLLHRYTGGEDIVVGTTIANRSHPEVENLIGFFVNTLVLRTDLSGNPAFRELLAREREVALGAYAHQDLPFEKLVEELQPERRLSHTPLFQVVFSMQNDPMPASELPGLSLTRIDVDSGTAMFDLVLGIANAGDAMHGLFLYNTDLFEATTISRLRDNFIKVLEEVAEHPEQHIIDIPLLSQKNKGQPYAATIESRYGVEQFDF